MTSNQTVIVPAMALFGGLLDKTLFIPATQQ